MAGRLGIEVYGAEIINGIAAEANVSLADRGAQRKLDAVDAWIYSAVFGKHVSRDQYVHFLSTAVRGLYHTGGVIVGRGGHVIFAGRDVLRVRIVGSVEHAQRASPTRKGSPTPRQSAKCRTATSGAANSSGTCSTRYNEPTNFDLVVNTDYFAASTTSSS